MSQVALVTGATSGIGAVTAVALVKAGYLVYGAGRRKDRLAKMERHGVIGLPMDLADPDSVDEAVNAVLQRHQRIDLLVNNAGYGEFGAIEDVPLERARRQLEVNVLAQMRLVQLVVPAMRQQGAGRIINVTSMGGKFAMAFGGWYHASKFALEALSDALRQELAPFGIKVILVEPGAIRTEWSQVAGQRGRLSSGQGVYAARANRVTDLLNNSFVRRLQSGPSVVAKAIVKAARAPRPRTRYVMGFGARSVLFLRRVLPDRVLDKVLSLLSS
ncbi:MAG: oxidoreductase [Micrococcales bacterium]|nr:oxidoreductase [Micrococcales bacterium]